MASGFQLKDDYTFVFGLSYGAADYTAEGVWKVENGAVVLTTKGPKREPFKLMKSAQVPKAEAIQVRVIGMNGRGVPNIGVIGKTAAGANSTARTDSQGVALFRPDQPLVSCQFEIRVYQYLSEPIALDRTHADYTFEIDGAAITTVRFEGEKVEHKADGNLLLRYFNPDHPLEYRRIE